MGEQTEASRYYPDGTVRLPDALEAWVDSVMEGDKGDDPDQRLTWDQVRNVVDVVLWQLIYRAADPDDLNEDATRALLDALDAITRDDVRPGFHAAVERADANEARAEWAERERDAEQQEGERLRKALWDIATTRCECGDGSQCKTCYARAALSADAEPGTCSKCDGAGAIPSGAATGTLWNCTRCHGTGEYPPPSMRKADAEPERPRCLTCEDTGLYPPGNDDGYGCWDCNQRPQRRAEPSRAEADPPGEHVWDCGCMDDVEADGTYTPAVVCDDHLEPGDQQQHCYWCGGLLPPCWWYVKPNHECVHACDIGVMRREEYFRAKADAAGGRPREADPQGPPNGTGDASVDGGGDDGRSRAIEAAAYLEPVAPGADYVNEEVSRAVIDAALASGGVVTREDAAARWEAIIRDLDPYCPYGCGTCPDCRALQVVERAGEDDRA